ncbi:uncharacterized protein [Oscarella lobularis]|uniref:uncharacterized protein isoform X3 n=1 Tax=Oscarella lobularis TaxID=121494 RepID=UPI003313768D
MTAAAMKIYLVFRSNICVILVCHCKGQGTSAIVHKNPDLFKQIFSLFDEFEDVCRIMSSDPNAKCKTVLGKIKRAVKVVIRESDKNFFDDFPFYVLVAQRLLNYQEECHDVADFRLSCRQKLGLLNQAHISSILFTFLSSDVSLSVGGRETESSELLYDYFSFESKYWVDFKNGIKRVNRSADDLGCAFTTLSISAFLHQKLKRPIYEREYWKNRFIKYIGKGLLWSTDVLDSLERGFSILPLLKLKGAFAFTVLEFVEVAQAFQIFDLEHLRKYLLGLYPYIHSNFKWWGVLCTELRAMKDRGPETSVAGREMQPYLAHASAFISTLHELCCSCEKTKDTTLHAEIFPHLRKWIECILRDLKIQPSDLQWPALVFSFSTKCPRSSANEAIISWLDDTSEITMEVFCLIVNKFVYLPEKVIAKYLERQKGRLDKRVDLTVDESWFKLFSLISEREFASLNPIVFACLQKLASFCEENDDSKLMFFEQLLMLSSRYPNVLSVPEASYEELASDSSSLLAKASAYIKEYLSKIETAFLRKAAKRVFNCLCGAGSSTGNFCQALLDAFCEVVVPSDEHLALPFWCPSVSSLLKILKSEMKICFSGVRKSPSEKVLAVWKILATFCRRLPAEKFQLLNPPGVTELAEILANVLRKEGRALEDDNGKLCQQWFAAVSLRLQNYLSDVLNGNFAVCEIEEHAQLHERLTSLYVSFQCSTKLRLEDVEAAERKFQDVKRRLTTLLQCGDSLQWRTIRSLFREWQVAENASISDLLNRCIRSYDFVSANLKLRFNPTVSLKQCVELAEAVESWLQPLKPLRDFLRHFYSSKRRRICFEAFLKNWLQDSCSETVSPETVDSATSVFSWRNLVARSAGGDDKKPVKEISVMAFAAALHKTKESLQSLLELNVCFKDVAIIRIREGDVELELRDLSAFFDSRKYDEDVSEKIIIDMLRLVCYPKAIESLGKIFSLYEMRKCLESKEYRQLERLRAAFEEGQMLCKTAEECSKLKAEIDKVLELSEEKCSLFSAILDYQDFFHFIRKKKFFGEKGIDSFRQQLDLIKNQLQGQDDWDHILPQLSVAFEYVAPFADPEITFERLVDSMKAAELVREPRNAKESQEPRNVYHHIRTVNKHVKQIKIWFTRAQDDMLEDVTRDLEAILRRGYFEIFVDDNEKLHCRLRYRRRMASEVESRSLDKSLRLEELNNFIRKLGGTITSRTDADIFETQDFYKKCILVREIFSLSVQLLSLGHPNFCEQTFRTCNLKCDSVIGEFEEVRTRFEKNLEEWTDHVKTLREQNSLLLLFSMKAILLMAKQLVNAEEASKAFFLVSCLFSNDRETFELLKHRLEESFATCNEDLERIEMIGVFLRRLTTYTDLKPCLFPKRRTLDEDKGHFIHLAYGFSSDEVLRLIILEIYHGFPESYEFIRCTSKTTKEELNIFLHRALKFPCRIFTLLFVNKLSFELREKVLDFQLQRHSAEMTVHYVLTEHAVYREAPCVRVRRHAHGNFKNSHQDSQSIRDMFERFVLGPANVRRLLLVYGRAGDGKSHYIRKELSTRSAKGTCIVSLHEGFSPGHVVKELQSLVLSDVNTIYFNFTASPPPVAADARSDGLEQYKVLMEEVHWFLFSLFGLGFVQDEESGKCFRLTGSSLWHIFVEVPAYPEVTDGNKSLSKFLEDVPIFHYLGQSYEISPDSLFDLNDDVQLVCKYLKVYASGDIDRRLQNNMGEVKFSEDPPVPPTECYSLLENHSTKEIKEQKITQHLFIQYMARRCRLLEKTPTFTFNPGRIFEHQTKSGQIAVTDSRKLGSFLLSAMLEEVKTFCNPQVMRDWHYKSLDSDSDLHKQLVYNFAQGSYSFSLFSIQPDLLSAAEREDLKKLRISIPTFGMLRQREYLDEVLSQALDVMRKDGRLEAIDQKDYVLTADYVVKMLSIHERRVCGVPVVIEGETGVGKSFLIDMLSTLWRTSLQQNCERKKDHISTILQARIPGISDDERMRQKYEIPSLSNEEVEAVLEVSSALQQTGKVPSEKAIRLVCRHHYDIIAQALLDCLSTGGIFLDECQAELIAQVQDPNECNEENSAMLLKAVFSAEQPYECFYKLNVHEALTPADVEEFLSEPIKVCHTMLKQSELVGHQVTGTVVAFFDEINTSMCMGLFKELLVDRSLNGRELPSNLFIIAACNPHRGSSTAIQKESKREDWMLGYYNVRPLSPTLKILCWDYGALSEKQEAAYIHEKLIMFNANRGLPRDCFVSDVQSKLVSCSQNAIRKFAFEELKSHKPKLSFDSEEMKRRAASTVSQRDIQRVFDLTSFFCDKYFRENENSPPDAVSLKDEDVVRKALLVSLGVVYYFRLDTHYRKLFCKELEAIESGTGEEPFESVFENEVQLFVKGMHIPKGIAKTKALEENLFATVVCTVNRIPLIIVGAPGSSKTLSFSVTLANLKGSGYHRIFQDLPSLDPYYFQCSKRSATEDIKNLFRRAIERQTTFKDSNWPVNCVVFLDEAGLPEEKRGSLKVLHFYLDNPKVSFVASTNHILDAAKSNRAVNLLRSKTDQSDLQKLAEGCMQIDDSSRYPQLKETMMKLCQGYDQLIEKNEFKNYFGLRDFIHFVRYLGRHRNDGFLSIETILRGLERNFNGHPRESFPSLCLSILRQITSSEAARTLLSNTRRRTLDILRESLSETVIDCDGDGGEAQVRYKLIIDESEDDSLISHLFKHEILDRATTSVLSCSDFPGDDEIHSVNIMSAIRKCVSSGQTVILTQTENINERLYDLLNQRFRRVDDAESAIPRYYANIAIGSHSWPCRVHPNFRCVIFIRASEVFDAPPPFLNRFEKFYLSEKDVLEEALVSLPPALQKAVTLAKDKVQEFENAVKSRSFYGLKKGQTVTSIFLQLLPSSSVKSDFRMASLIQDSCDSDNSETFYDCADEIFYDSFAYDWSKEKIEVLKQLEIGLAHIGFCFPEKRKKEKSTFADVVFSSAFVQAKIGRQRAELLKRELGRKPSAILEWLESAIRNFERPESSSYESSCEQAGFAIASVVHWLIFCACTQLLQILVPEAIILNRNVLPRYLLEQYIDMQSHFSLQEFIERVTGSTKFSQKIICFTRSSSSLITKPSQKQSQRFLREERISDIAESFPDVQMQKLEEMGTLDSFTSTVDAFTRSRKRLYLLLANMEVCSKGRIDLVRRTIEEKEINRSGEVVKSFLLLLHFPPSMGATDPCYSSDSRPGWNLVYLDSITQIRSKFLIDIRQWARVSFLRKEEFLLSREIFQRSFENLLKTTLGHSLSRVVFGNDHGMFNKTMTASARTDMLAKLINDCPKFSSTLCKKFSSYWTKDFLLQEFDAAATFLLEAESSLSLGEMLQSRVESLLLKFVSYILCKLNEEYNLEILFESYSQSSHKHVKELFLEIFELMPVPQVNEIFLRNHSFDARNQTGYLSCFPFFKLVSSVMERQLEDCISSFRVRLSQTDSENGLKELPDQKGTVTADLLNRLQNLADENNEIKIAQTACIAIDACKDNYLWQCYLRDFSFFELNYNQKDSNGEDLKIFSELLCCPTTAPGAERLVTIHTLARFEQKGITQAIVLLQRLEFLNMEADCMPPARLATAVPSLLSDTGSQEERLCKLCINKTYEYLQKTMQNHNKEDFGKQLLKWRKVFSDLMKSLPFLLTFDYSQQNGRLKVQVMSSVFAIINTFDCERRSSTVPVGFCRDIFANGESIMEVSSGQLAERRFKSFPLSVLFESGATCVRAFYKLKDRDISTEIVCRSALVLKKLMTHFLSFYFPSLPPGMPLKCSLLDCETMLRFMNSQAIFFSASDMDGEMEETGEDDAMLACFRKTGLCPSGLVESSVLQDCFMHMLRTTGKLGVDKRTKFNIEILKLVGNILAEDQQRSSGTAVSYVPWFYQGFQEQRATQKPLASFYFHCCLERFKILYKETSLPHILMTITKVDAEMEEIANQPCAAVLCIERQALAQQFIEKYADAQMPQNKANLEQIGIPMMSKINKLIFDKQGEGGDKGHTLTFLCHLVKKLRSIRRVIALFKDHYEILFGHHSWANCIRNELANCAVVSLGIFPFMKRKNSSKRYEMFAEMQRLITDIKETSGIGCQTEIEAFKDFCRYTLRNTSVDTLLDVRMMLWLNIYNIFYKQKVENLEFAEALQESFDFLDLEDSQRHLLACFVFPDKRVINRSAARTSCGEIKKTEQFDPVQEFFDSQDDSDLKQALALLVAVSLGVPHKTTHLWTALFSAKDLNGKYLCGSMSASILTNGSPRNSAFTFTGDGNCQNLDYSKLLSASPLSQRSRYLLLWSNLGAFAVSLLTLRQSEEVLGECVFCHWKSLRQDCISSLKQIWQFIRDKFDFLEEERQTFVSAILLRFLEVGRMEESLLSTSSLSTLEDVQIYEGCFHDMVFEPVLRQFEDKSNFDCIWPETSLLRDCRNLLRAFPVDANYEKLARSIENAEKKCSKEKKTFGCGILKTFVAQRRIFRAGGLLLPDLLDFYNWIHRELAHVLSKDRAAEITVESVFLSPNLLQKRFLFPLPERAKQMRSLFRKVKEKYNDYVKIANETIQLSRGKELKFIDRSTVLMQLLSVEQGRSSEDLLYTVIQDIIERHNEFLFGVCREEKTVYPSGLSYDNCLLGDVSFEERRQYKRTGCLPSDEESDFAGLVHKHYLDSHSAHKRRRFRSLPKTCDTFDLDALQEDVVKHFLNGLPLIDKTKPLRIDFNFGNNSTKGEAAHSSSEEGILEDLKQMRVELHVSFQEQLPAETKKMLQINFHTLLYHQLLAIFIALRTVACHLRQTVLRPANREETCDTLSQQTLKGFLMDIYELEESLPTEISLANTLGVRTLDENLVENLLEIRLSYLFFTADFFSQKLLNEEYEFAHLPITLKTVLEENDQKWLLSLQENYKRTYHLWQEDTQEPFTQQIRRFDQTLRHKERSMSQEPQTYLKRFLLDKETHRAEEFPTHCLPDSIKVEHYMWVRICLRRLIYGKHLCLKVETQAVWSEQVSNLWESFPFVDLGDDLPEEPLRTSSALQPERILFRRMWFDQQNAIDSRDKKGRTAQDDTENRLLEEVHPE